MNALPLRRATSLVFLFAALSLSPLHAQDTSLADQAMVLLELDSPDTSDVLGDTQPGQIEGEGIHFEIHDSPFLNVTLDSTAPVVVLLSSQPDMIRLDIAASGDTLLPTLTLSGLEPGATYHLHTDHLDAVTALVADATGTAQWAQDLLEPRFLSITTAPSTHFLKPSAGQFPPNGSWDATTRTFTFTGDLYETLEILEGNLTVDGAGFAIVRESAPGAYLTTGYGVYFYRQSNVTLRDLHTFGGYVGIEVKQSHGAALIDCSSHYASGYGLAVEQSNNYAIDRFLAQDNGRFGMYFWSSSYGTVRDSSALFNETGLRASGARYAQFTNNTVQGNSYQGVIFWNSYQLTLSGNQMTGNTYNFGLRSFKEAQWAGIAIDDTNQVDGGPVRYLTDAVGHTIDGSAGDTAGMVICVRCSGLTVRNMTFQNAYTGLFLWKNQDAVVTDNHFEANEWGVLTDDYENAYYASDTTNLLFENNTFVGNGQGGLALRYAKDSLVRTNSFTDNQWGLYGDTWSDRLRVEGNTFTNNREDAMALWGRSMVVSGNTVTGSLYAVDMSNAPGTLIENNVFDGNSVGLRPYLSNSIRVDGNLIRGTSHGVYLLNSSYGQYTNNTFEGQMYGAYEHWNSAGNQFINNNFLDIHYPVWLRQAQVFFQQPPVGGNYWDRYTGVDADGDGFGDTPFTYQLAHDAYPWVHPNGWRNSPPVANAGADRVTIEGLAVLLNGSGSFDDDGYIVDFRWDFGDGAVLSGTEDKPWHTFPTTGVTSEYLVTLTVTDDQGAVATDAATVTVLTLPNAVAQLRAAVADLNLARGIENALDAKIDALERALEAANAGERQDAANHLHAFINAVEAQRGNALTDAQADLLIDLANWILSAIV